MASTIKWFSSSELSVRGFSNTRERLSLNNLCMLELIRQQTECPIYLNARLHRAYDDPSVTARPGHEKQTAIMLLNSGLAHADTLTGRFHGITNLQ